MRKRIKRISSRILVQGKYRPKNPSKYKGDPTNIIYRSSWELTVFKYLDNNPSILKWASEEVFIPYRHPLTNRISRYFPDCWLRYKNNKGEIVETIWEIKPKKQTVPPTYHHITLLFLLEIVFFLNYLLLTFVLHHETFYHY